VKRLQTSLQSVCKGAAYIIGSVIVVDGGFLAR